MTKLQEQIQCLINIHPATPGLWDSEVESLDKAFEKVCLEWIEKAYMDGFVCGLRGKVRVFEFNNWLKENNL